MDENNWALAPLERGGDYSVIYADPAWDLKSNSKDKPGRNPRRHYKCMGLDEIQALPVRDLVAPQAILFMWITGPFFVLGAHIPIMKAWGFKPSAVGFTWVKTQRKAPSLWITAKDLHMGTGFTTRKNAEFCLIGKRGKSLRKSARVHEILISPVMEHSRKPDEFRNRIQEYVGPGLRMAELFARETRPGWEVWGNETDKFTGGE